MFRKGTGARGDPLGFADKKSFPYPHSSSPIPQISWVACLHHLALAMNSGVGPLPLYVIDGSDLHGPGRAAVGVALMG